MTAERTTQHAPDEFQTLMRNDRVYCSLPVWQVRVSPGEFAIVTRSYWKFGIANFGLFASLGIGFFVAAGWANIDGGIARLCSWAGWFCCFMAAAFLGGVLVFEKYRSRKAWLVCRPLERTVSCPRLNATYDFDDVYALQLITGKVARSDPGGRSVMTVTQLNLITKEHGRLQRYPLIGDYTPGRLSKHAELLSEQCGMRLAKDKVPSVTEWA